MMTSGDSSQSTLNTIQIWSWSYQNWQVWQKGIMRLHTQDHSFIKWHTNVQPSITIHTLDSVVIRNLCSCLKKFRLENTSKITQSKPCLDIESKSQLSRPYRPSPLSRPPSLRSTLDNDLLTYTPRFAFPNSYPHSTQFHIPCPYKISNPRINRRDI